MITLGEHGTKLLNAVNVHMYIQSNKEVKN